MPSKASYDESDGPYVRTPSKASYHESDGPRVGRCSDVDTRAPETRDRMQVRKHILFNVLNQLPYWPFFFFGRQAISTREAWEVYRLTMNNMKQVPLKRSSDVLAIMGSGSSINELDKDDLLFLDSVDVVAINRWAHHDLTPDLYMCEGVPPVELINNRAEQYRNVVFLLKYMGWSRRWGNLAEGILQFDPILRSRIRLLRIRLIQANSTEDLSTSYFDGLEATDPQPQCKGSVASALSLGYAMGYQTLILYGIDIKAGYFWEEEDREGLHQSSVGEFGIDKFIRWMRKEVFLSSGREVFVGSKSSLLFPEIPVWNNDRNRTTIGLGACSG